ncbi:histidine phosphatase family protein [Pantanalinema rosaneae CENA516]|uniref:histidine phosphatase family protein n=1 Tax=Pantanalinema rosaneae TaxID=1620701 RepID=UPI003D6FEEEA
MHQFLKLLFIRHAQSTGNVERRMQGQGEFELTEVGKQQAEKLAKSLLAEGWIPSQVYSSPSTRTRQTTQILMDHFVTAPLPAAVSDLIGGEADPVLEVPDDRLRAIPITYAEELMEFQNGIFQGLTWAEATQRYPELCQQLEASPDWIPIPEAESLEMARSRAKRFIQRLLHQHRNGDHIWIITHSWILQHLVAELLGCDRSWRLRATNTALFEFWVDQSRWFGSDPNRFNTDLWQIRRINDYHHLQS